MSNSNRLTSSNIPEWLCPLQGLGKYNPASLSGSEDILALKPVKKNIILDLNSFSFYTKQTIEFLLKEEFPLYYFCDDGSPKKLNLFEELKTQFNTQRNNDAIVFNSTDMWQALYTGPGLIAKIALLLVLQGIFLRMIFLISGNYFLTFLEKYYLLIPDMIF